MNKEPAAWRKRMTDDERRELSAAKEEHDASGDNLRELTKLYKNRCVQRMRRKADGGD